MLSLKGVDAGYDDALTLRGVSLEVERGEIVAMIGANGAGKSTTLRTICGFLRPRKGSIEFDGRPIAGLTPDRIAALGLVHVPEGRRVFPELTVEENLLAAAYLLRDRKEVQRRLAETMERFALRRQRRKQAAGTLSGGQPPMLALRRAFITGRDLPLPDRPSRPPARGGVSGPVKSGGSGQIRGNAAAHGQSLATGIQMGVKASNAAGGVLGRQTDLVIGDDAGKPEEAGVIARRFAPRDNVCIAM